MKINNSGVNENKPVDTVVQSNEQNINPTINIPVQEPIQPIVEQNQTVQQNYNNMNNQSFVQPVNQNFNEQQSSFVNLKKENLPNQNVNMPNMNMNTTIPQNNAPMMNNVNGVRFDSRVSKPSSETGNIETIYFYACPNCGHKMEFKSKYLMTVEDGHCVCCPQCNNNYNILKPTANDYKTPSIMDTFGDFITPDKNQEGVNMLDCKGTDDVLDAIRDSFGINIPKESLNKLPVGVKKVLRDLFSI